MISLTSGIDHMTRIETHNALWLCSFERYQNLLVVNIQDIEALIALLPYANTEYFIMEDLGNSVATALAGYAEQGEEDGALIS